MLYDLLGACMSLIITHLFIHAGISLGRKSSKCEGIILEKLHSGSNLC